jgi:ABC-2 type transport system ATP-binding protein
LVFVRRVLVTAACLVLGAVSPANAFAKDPDLKIAMSDGVVIAATLYVPDGEPPVGGWPAVMLLHGIGESRSDGDNALGMSINSLAETFLRPQGYAVLTFDARGHGASGGVVAIDGPREITDVRQLFDWLVSRPFVNRDRIGAFGYSYGGGAIWRAAVEGVPFAAIEPAVCWTDLYRALVPQDLARSGVILGFYQSIAGRVAPEIDPILQAALAGRDLGRVRAFAAERSSRPRLSGLRVPTFMLQGRRDFAFDLEHALSAYRLLRGPKRLYLADFGHAPSARPGDEPYYVLPQARAWFDRFLKGLPNGIDRRPPVELARDPWTGRTSSYAGLPARKTLRIVFAGAGSIGARGKVARTRRLPRGRHETFGAPTVRVALASSTGWPHVVAVLSALTPRGREIVVSSGGARVRLNRKAKTVAVRLVSQVTNIPPGSRLRLTVAAASTAQSPSNLLYLTNVPASARLAVGKASVTLPLLARPVSR